MSQVVWTGLALAFALVVRWDVGQWQVPKAWARIFLGCRAVGFGDESLSFTLSKSPNSFIYFLLSHVVYGNDCLSRGENLIGGIVERYFVVLENLSGYTEGHCC